MQPGLQAHFCVSSFAHSGKGPDIHICGVVINSKQAPRCLHGSLPERMSGPTYNCQPELTSQVVAVSPHDLTAGSISTLCDEQVSRLISTLKSTLAGETQNTNTGPAPVGFRPTKSYQGLADVVSKLQAGSSGAIELPFELKALEVCLETVSASAHLPFHHLTRYQIHHGNLHSSMESHASSFWFWVACLPISYQHHATFCDVGDMF